MKKSIAFISILIIILSVCLTACNGNNIIVDEDGETHVLATNKDGSLFQNQYGNIFEVLTDENGEKVTKGFVFPEKITNKHGNRIENPFIVLNIPKNWVDFSSNGKISMKHEGTCLDMNTTRCNVDVSWDIMASNEVLYENYMGPVRWLIEYGSGFGDLKEYETEICGLHARAVSYRAVDEGGTFYYYLVERGLAAFEIEAYACDDCFTEDELKEVIADAYTLKDLGGVRPTDTSEESTSAE